MEPNERYTKQDIYLFFLIEGLTINLLPELIPLIRQSTFAPYHISGILRTVGDDAVRPIELSCYSPLSIELLKSESDFNIIFTALNLTLERGKYGLLVSMMIPNREIPLHCHWATIEETPLKYVCTVMIHNANKHLAQTGSRLRFK